MKIFGILFVGWLGYQLGKSDWRVRSSLTVAAVLLAVIFHAAVQLILPHAAIEHVASAGAWSPILVPITLLETIGIWLPVLLVPWAGGRTRIMTAGYVMVAAIQGALVYYQPFDVVIMNGERLGPTHPSYAFALVFALVFAIPPFAFAVATRRRRPKGGLAGTLQPTSDGEAVARRRMRRLFLGFTFEREAKWLVVLYVLVPLLLILLAILIPGILRRWSS